MGAILDPILSSPSWLVLLVVGLVVFAEDAIFIGFVIPGETAAILGGVAANLGHVSVWEVGLTVILAAILGDTVGYEIGRRFGPRVLDHRLLAKRRPQIAQAEDLLARRGGGAVLLGRWVAFLRAVMPGLAGASRMRYPTFLLFNGLGGVLWGTTAVAIGYLAGRSYQTFESYLGRGAAIVAAILVVAGLIVWHRRRHQAAATASGTDPPIS